MSARTILSVLAGTLAIGVLLPAFALLPAAAELPELAVRNTSWHVDGGWILRDEPPGEGFRCEDRGLRRIDVRARPIEVLVSQPFELRLRRGTRDGEIVRRAEFDPRSGPREHNWLAFEFEPIEDSAGETFFFDIVPAGGAAEMNCGLWIRYRGQVGEKRPGGELSVEGRPVEAIFKSPMPDLSAIAVAMEKLAPDVETVLEVREVGGSSRPLRRSAIHGRAVRDGYAFFPFEPIPESYGKTYRLVLRLPEGAAAGVHDDQLSFTSWHGAHEPDPDLLGMTLGGELLTDRDLFFRAWTARGVRHDLAVLEERLGPRLALALGAWLATVALVLFLVLGRARPAPPARTPESARLVA